MKDLNWSTLLVTKHTPPSIADEKDKSPPTGMVFHKRAVLTASLVLAAFLIVGAGLFFKASHFNLRFKNLNPIVNQVTEQVSPQPNRPKESVGSASPQARAKVGLIKGPILVKKSVEEVNSQTWQNSPNHNDNQNPGLSPGPKNGNRKTGNLMIQVGAFKERATAKGLVKKLQERGYNARVLEKISKKFGLLYRVRIHGYASMSEARMATSQLKKQGFGDVFIARPEKTKMARKNKQAIVAQSTQ